MTALPRWRTPAVRAAAAAGGLLLAGAAAYALLALPLRLAGIAPANAMIPALRGGDSPWEALYGWAAFSLTAAAIVYVAMHGLHRRAKTTGPCTATGKLLAPLVTALGILGAAAAAHMLQLVSLADEAAASGPAAFVLLAAEYGLLGIAAFAVMAGRIRHALEAAAHGAAPIPRSPQESAAGLEQAEPMPAETDRLQAGVAEQYETLAAELRLALDLQQRWQPPIDLQLGAYRVTGRNRQDRELGGDLFEAAIVDDTSFAVLVGDVSGKGMPAAVMVPALHVLFRSELKRGGGPAEMLERINRLLCESAPDNGVTLGIGLGNAATGEMRYASAGHPSPYLIKQGAQPIMLDSSSLPLGMDPDAKYGEQTIRFAPGERLLLYTDGIIEASDAAGEMFGFERLERELTAWEPSLPASGWIDDLFGMLDERYDRRKDDRTVITVERIFQAARPVVLHEKTWRVSSLAGCEKQVLGELACLIDEAWPEAGRKDDMLTCVAEAVMNAAEHGNGFDPQRSVVVHVHFGNMLMVCRVSDEGEGFDAQQFHAEAQRARLEPEAELRTPAAVQDGRGWGMLLIDGLTDYWIATRDQHGFCVELFFLARQRNG